MCTWATGAQHLHGRAPAIVAPASQQCTLHPHNSAICENKKVKDDESRLKTRQEYLRNIIISYLNVGLSTVLSNWATRSPKPSLTASRHQSLPWWSGGSNICASRLCTAGFMYLTGCFGPGTQFSINGNPQLTISHTFSCRSFKGFLRLASSRPLSIKADVTVAGDQECIAWKCA